MVLGYLQAHCQVRLGRRCPKILNMNLSINAKKHSLLLAQDDCSQTLVCVRGLDNMEASTYMVLNRFPTAPRDSGPGRGC